VHRDIKPGNILLTTDEQGQETAKVLDFGIAKLREAVGDANTGMTMTGMVWALRFTCPRNSSWGKKRARKLTAAPIFIRWGGAVSNGNGAAPV